MCGAPNDGSCRVPAGRIECAGGPLVEAEFRLGMEVEPSGIPSSAPVHTTGTGSRSVCFSGHDTVASLCQLATRPIYVEDQCVHSQLVRPPRLRISSIQSEIALSAEAGAGGVHVSNDHTDVAGCSLVSSAVGPVCGDSHTPPSQSRALDECTRRATFTGGGTTATAHGLDSVRQSWSSRGLPEPVSNLLTASWRDKTQRHYESAWSVWRGWCTSRSFDPVSPPAIDTILQFLRDQYHDGKAYRTLGTYRSALSNALGTFDGHLAGTHLLVIRLMRGVYNTRPPQPRYASTWDASIVLDHLASWSDCTSLSLKQLTLKLTMLLALVGAFRASEIRHISVAPIQRTSDGVVLQLSALSKSQRSGALKKEVIPSFSQTSRCPVLVLEEYVKRTADLRPDDSTQLLISFRKPHRPVSAPSVSRWLLEVMALAGIDTSIFKGHSTRGASASQAAAASMSADDIVKAVG